MYLLTLALNAWSNGFGNQKRQFERQVEITWNINYF